MEIDRKTIKILSSDTRVAILKALKERRKMPSELARELSLKPSTIVAHLEKLQEARLIEKQRTERKWIYYELTKRGTALIKPKPSMPFVLILTIGIILVFGGFANISYDTQAAFSYPMITIEKTITKISSPSFTTTAGATEGVGEVTETESSSETVEEDIKNETRYATGQTSVQSINWLAIIVMMIGIVLVTISVTKFYTKNSVY